MFAARMRRCLLACAAIAAIAVLALSIQADPAAELAHARELMAAKDYAGAIKTAEPLTSDPANGPAALQLVAQCETARGGYAKAAEAYITLLSRFPNSDCAGRSARETLLACHILAQSWDQAIALAEKLLNDYPDGAALWYYKIATCRIAQGKHGQAETALKRCIASAGDPKDADVRKEAMRALAGVYELMGEWPSFISQAQTLAEEIPQEAAVWRLREGAGYQRQGRHDLALVAFKKCMELADDKGSDTRRAAAGSMLASYELSGDWKSLAEQAKSLSAQYPQEAPLWHLKAMLAYSKLDDETEAAASLASAVEAAKGSKDPGVRRTVMSALLDSYGRAGKWEELTSSAEKLAADDPPHAAVWLLRARQGYAKRGKTAQAIAVLKKAAEAAVGPDNTGVCREAMTALVDTYEASRDWANAAEQAAKLAEEWPERCANLRYRAGMALHKQGKNKEAAAALSKAVEAATGPTNADLRREAMRALAGVYELAEDWENLTSQAEKLVTEVPQEALLWYLKASIGLERRGKSSESVEALNKGIETATKLNDKTNLKLLYDSLTQAYRLHGLGDAEGLLLKLAQQYPEDAATYLFWYAMCPKNRNDFAGAAARFQQVADKYPNDMMGQHALMEVYACLLLIPGKKAEAEAAWKKLWDEHPDFRPEALYVRAEVQVMYTKDYEEALRCLKQIRKEYAGSPVAKRPETAQLLASVLAKVGQVDRAAQALREALPKDASPAQKAETWNRIGRMYAEAKRHREAIRAYREVTTLKDVPDLTKAEAAYRMGMCYHAIGSKASAERCMREVAAGYPRTRWAREARGALYVWAAYGPDARIGL